MAKKFVDRLIDVLLAFGISPTMAVLIVWIIYFWGKK